MRAFNYDEARRARAILNDPVFQLVLQEGRADLIEEWENGTDVNDREAAWAKLQGLGYLVRSFERAAADAEAVEFITKRENTSN